MGVLTSHLEPGGGAVLLFYKLSVLISRLFPGWGCGGFTLTSVLPTMYDFIAQWLEHSLRHRRGHWFDNR